MRALLLLGVLLLFARTAAAEPVSLLRPVAPEQPWKVKAGDDPAWADPDLDDSAWESPAHSIFGWNLDPRFRGAPIVWHRQHIEIVPVEGQEIGLQILVQGAADLYVEGRQVASVGEVGRAPGRIAGFTVVIPPELLADGSLDVAVRAWMPWSWLAQGGLVYGPVVGDPAWLATIADRDLARRREDAMTVVVEAVLAFVAGVAHLVLFARRRDLRAHFWFGLGTLAHAVFLSIDLLVWRAWMAPFPGMSAALGITQGVYFAAMTLFCVHFFRAGARLGPLVAAWVFVGTSVRLAVWVWWAGQMAPFDVALVAPGVLFALWTLQEGVRHGVIGARTVGGGIVLFLLWPVSLVLVAAGLLPLDWLVTIRAACTLVLTGAMVLGLAEQFGSSLDELERTYKAARWFVPYELLERLGRTKIGDVRRGDAARLEMTMLFFDIRGFTTLAEAHPPEKTFAFVNALFDRLEPHIRGNRGFVIQFTGDGFLALFPDADGAVQAALDQLRSLATFRDPLLGGEPIRVGIGVHTGPMMLGTIGGRDQLLAGVVADAANLASRIEGMTKLYGVSVLISEVTRDRLAHPERFALRELDRVVAKGRREPIGVIEVRDAAAPAPFEPAYQSYRAGAFGEALSGFEACAGDGPAAVLAERCRRFLASPPPSWDGVWRLDTK